jgi:two-component system response regulator (stage 0 sporulation protein A)
VTKVLYPEVAKRCDCDPSHVERSIRSAIEAAWKRRDDSIWKLYFPEEGMHSGKRPTNSAFIARLAQSLEQHGMQPLQTTEVVQNIPKNHLNVRE